MNEHKTTTITIPGLRLVSEANTTGHWRTKAKRVKSQRRMAWANLRMCGVSSFDGPIAVTITRIAPRALDTDNLASSAKAVRDEIAAWLGRDDGPKSGIVWSVEQRRGEPKTYAVEIRIERRTA